MILYNRKIFPFICLYLHNHSFASITCTILSTTQEENRWNQFRCVLRSPKAIPTKFSTLLTPVNRAVQYNTVRYAIALAARYISSVTGTRDWEYVGEERVWPFLQSRDVPELARSLSMQKNQWTGPFQLSLDVFRQELRKEKFVACSLN